MADVADNMANNMADKCHVHAAAAQQERSLVAWRAASLAGKSAVAEEWGGQTKVPAVREGVLQ